ncbi:hypothetical protein CPC16_004887 [Podila verticillata]|nr:hypothetical protein CPC16_004887 [Podila verticillata]
MSVYTMTLDSGLYFWSLMGRCTIPIDRSQLIAVIPVLRLLNSLEIFTDSIDVTSTSIPQEKEFRPTILSPSRRKLF